MNFLSSLFDRFRLSNQKNGQKNDAGSAASAGTPSKPKQLEVKDLRAEWIIIGLGNPGAKYAATRHNIGYWPVDALLAEHQEAQPGLQWTPVRGVKAQVAQVTISDKDVLLVRSTTYMNDSGEAVGPIAKALDVPADHVIVLHDELDIAKGQVRIKAKGGEGGHNGLRSMTAQLGTQEYVRVRMGIGRPPQGVPVIDYVLSPFEDGDLDSASGWMDTCLTDAADAVRLIVAHGPDIARNDIHTRHK